jgi:hypothetical protein
MHADASARTLEFRRVSKWSIEPFIDGVALKTLLDEPDACGLSKDEGRVVARLLQGWKLPAEPMEFALPPVPMGLGTVKTISSGSAFVVERDDDVELPGGSRPSIGSFVYGVFGDPDENGIPVLTCECGSGVGCGDIEMRMERAGTFVIWTIGDERFEFSLQEHERAILGLLKLVGERQRLIED